MAQNIILTFALLYSACIALIAAVYVALLRRNERKAKEIKLSEEEHN